MVSTNTEADDQLLTHGARHIRVVSTEEFDKVLTRHSDVLAWFTTSWCGPCAAMAPALDEFAGAHADRLVVVAVDGDDNHDLQRRLHVKGYPTLNLFHRGVWVASNPPPEAGEGDPFTREGMAATFLPLVAAAARFNGGGIRSLATPPPRPARTLVLPDVGNSSVVLTLYRPGDGSFPEPAEPGTYELPAGCELSVSVSADYRLDPPIDLSFLQLLQPHSVDVLEVHGAPVRVADLAAYPAIDQIHSLVIDTGAAGATPDELAVFRNLVAFESDGSDTCELPDVLANLSWVSPDLRAPSDPGESGTAIGSLLEVDEADFDAATGAGQVLVVVPGPVRVPNAVAALLTQLAADVGDLRVVLVSRVVRAAIGARFDVSEDVASIVILCDGNPVWISDAVVDETSFREVLLPAVAAASRPDAIARAPRRPRPERTVDLPDLPPDCEVALTRPDLGAYARGSIQDGGRVTVPAGVSVAVAIVDVGGDADAFDWSVLDTLGPDDVDELTYYDYRDVPDKTLSTTCTATIQRLTGLRRLVVPAPATAAEFDSLCSALRPLTALRALTLETPDDGAVPTEQLTTLRRILPNAIINGTWSGLGDVEAVASDAEHSAEEPG